MSETSILDLGDSDMSGSSQVGSLQRGSHSETELTVLHRSFVIGYVAK